jgi:hypothetical protein
MLKRDKNFKLPKYVKTQMAFMPKDKASEYRNLMIEAIIKSSVPVKSKKQQKETTTDEE